MSERIWTNSGPAFDGALSKYFDEAYALAEGEEAVVAPGDVNHRAAAINLAIQGLTREAAARAIHDMIVAEAFAQALAGFLAQTTDPNALFEAIGQRVKRLTLVNLEQGVGVASATVGESGKPN